jgi:hypothetical protein
MLEENMGRVKAVSKKARSHAIELRPAMDQFLLKGRFSFMLGDVDGNPLWKEPRYCKNTVVTSGRSWVLKHIMSAQSANVSSQIITAIAVGSSGTAPTTSDTLLGGEIKRNAALTETDNSGSSAPNCVWAVSFSTSEGNDTVNGIREFGVFNTTAANAQTMLARASTASFTKTTSNTLTVSYTISF